MLRGNYEKKQGNFTPTFAFKKTDHYSTDHYSMDDDQRPADNFQVLRHLAGKTRKRRNIKTFRAFGTYPDRMHGLLKYKVISSPFPNTRSSCPAYPKD